MAASSVSVSVPAPIAASPPRPGPSPRPGSSQGGDAALPEREAGLRAFQSTLGFAAAAATAGPGPGKRTPEGEREGGKLLPLVPAGTSSPGQPRAAAVLPVWRGCHLKLNPQKRSQRPRQDTSCPAPAALPRAEARRASAATPRPCRQTTAPLGLDRARPPEARKAPCGKTGWAAATEPAPAGRDSRRRAAPTKTLYSTCSACKAPGGGGNPSLPKPRRRQGPAAAGTRSRHVPEAREGLPAPSASPPGPCHQARRESQ